MRKEVTLLDAYDRLSKEFSSTCQKVRGKASERPIHHLRVTSRRWIAVLDLIPELAQNRGAQRLRRHLQKVIKWTSPLRDMQVQLDKVSRFEKVDLRRFSRELQQHEKQAIADIREHLKQLMKSGFTERVEAVRNHFDELYNSLDRREVQREITKTLEARAKKFRLARKKFRTNDEDTLHDMRIALKKLRYSTEAAQPVLGRAVIQNAPNMKWFQQLVGDARDAFILEAELSKWAARRGKQKRIGKALEQLNQERETFLAKITDILPSLAGMTVVAPKRAQAKSRGTDRQLKIGEKTFVISAPTSDSPAPVNELAAKSAAAGSRSGSAQ
jgi:CHAD domain-containing protein